MSITVKVTNRKLLCGVGVTDGRSLKQVESIIIRDKIYIVAASGEAN
jgi:hypothetical protein